MKRLRWAFSLISFCTILGGGLPGWAQEPPAPTLKIPGIGAVELLPELAEGDYVFFGKLQLQDLGALRLIVVLNHEEETGDYYQLRLTAQEAQFFYMHQDQLQPLGPASSAGNLLQVGEATQVAVRREGWRLSLLLDGRLVCGGYDATLTAGEVGYTLLGGTLEDPLLQFLGEMYFHDDFMRGTEERSLWKPISGEWQEESLRIDPQAQEMQETRSANAFSYLGRGQQGRALTTVGYWFWTDYRVQAAVRPRGEGACGLVACYHDPDNYLALRWTPWRSEVRAGDGSRLQIVQRLDGQEQVLAETPGGFRPQQWYRLGLAVSDGWVRGYLDDELRLVARTAVFRQGQSGLLAEGQPGCDFDDVELTPWGYFADNFVTPQRWDTKSGKWEHKDSRMKVSGAGTGLLLGPPCSWPRFEYSADIHLEKGSAGVVLGYAGPEQYYLFRYALGKPSSPRAEIVRVTGGQEQLLAAAPVRPAVGQAMRLGVVVDRNIISGLVGDQQVVQTALEATPTGRLGLYAHEAGGAWFSFAEAQRRQPPPVAHVTEEFRDIKEHWEMAPWASRRSAWLNPPGLLVEREGNMVLKQVRGPEEFGDHIWWTKGNYFGDKLMAFELGSLGKVSGTLRVILDAQPGEEDNPVGGYALALTAQRGSQELGLVLSSPEASLGETTVAIEGDKCRIEFSRTGPHLEVRVDDELVLQAQVSLR